jgi:hypothetical protein
MTDDPHSPQSFPDFQKLMSEYGGAFDAYDLESILDHYSSPCFILKDGKVNFLAETISKRAYFTDLLGSLRAAEIHHSEMPSLTVNPLGGSAAVVTVRWVSKKEDGSVVWDFLDSYFVVRVGSEWKFLGDAVHESDYARATSQS